jgi:DNA repair photolyase
MKYREIKFNNIINKISNIDHLFLGNYTIDPYQNCEFGCIYCDSSISEEIIIKYQAPSIVENELKKIKKGRVVIGSVHDPYQPAEEKYGSTREILNILNKMDIPYHILTKSNLILRDLDILSDKCIITISLSTLSQKKSKFLESNAPLPKDRLKILEKMSNRGLIVGIAIMPIIPYFTEEELEDIVKSAKEHGTNYIIWEFLELKGDQKHRFLQKIPHLSKKYETLYENNFKPNKSYMDKINSRLMKICRKYKIANSIRDILQDES